MVIMREARADHQHAPGDHSPLRGRIHSADCFSAQLILLAVRRRTIHGTPINLLARGRLILITPHSAPAVVYQR